MAIRTSAEHLAELNRVLREQPGYSPDMRFVPYPEGADPNKASGYQWRCDPETPEKLYTFVHTAHLVDGDIVIM